MQSGWTLDDVEESDFETLLQVVCAQPKKKKSKVSEVSLNDFVKSI